MFLYQVLQMTRTEIWSTSYIKRCSSMKQIQEKQASKALLSVVIILVSVSPCHCPLVWDVRESCSDCRRQEGSPVAWYWRYQSWCLRICIYVFSHLCVQTIDCKRGGQCAANYSHCTKVKPRYLGYSCDKNDLIWGKPSLGKKILSGRGWHFWVMVQTWRSSTVKSTANISNGKLVWEESIRMSTRWKTCFDYTK